MWFIIIISVVAFLMLMFFLYIQFHIEYREKGCSITYKRWVPTRLKFIAIILISLMPLVNVGFLIVIILNATIDNYEIRFVGLNRIAKIAKWLSTEMKIKD